MTKEGYFMRVIRVPAWTLNALIKICNSNEYYDDVTIKDNNGVFLFGKGFENSTNVYDNMIDCIEWLIKSNYLKIQKQ